MNPTRLLWVTPTVPAHAVEFARDLVSGLRARPRTVAPKYFYDHAGSMLFERICELPEYYPTRTEIGILQDRAADIAAHLGPDVELIEFGAGASRKVRLLLDALVAPRRYVPVDISADHVFAAAEGLRRAYPDVAVFPIGADFTQRLELPPAVGSRVGFFPGSSIGNFDPDEARRLLARFARWLEGGGLLIGVDLVKDPALLHAAYNDAQGVTAAFNLNLLARANRELGADFDLDRFAHHALYQPQASRIEMHLVSRCAQRVTVCGESFDFVEGESIHTENSYKYTVEGFQQLAVEAGFTPRAVWTDAQRWFALFWLEGR
jgi:dimethylhistidine N-methyltransferase